jgi:hypothetical protein
VRVGGVNYTKKGEMKQDFIGGVNSFDLERKNPLSKRKGAPDLF